MSTTGPIPSRTGLTANEIMLLQQSLDANDRGKVVDVPVGTPYDDGEIETLARVAEHLTQHFTSHFKKGGWHVRFVLLESNSANAYAYWMGSFEAICMTTLLAREIDTLSEQVARSLVRHAKKESGYAFLSDLDLTREQKCGMLKGLLIQGAIALFIGHEAGHLAAGHKPVVLRSSKAIEARASEAGFEYVDEVIAAVISGDEAPDARALLLNALEVDADVQGIALTSIFWLLQRSDILERAAPPPEAALLKAACEQPGRLLLVASTGAAIAIALMGFKKFTGQWDKQPTHPLTAVRCVISLAALGKMLSEDPNAQVSLHLRPECLEALTLVHVRLGAMLRIAARMDGKHSDLTLRLKKTSNEGRLKLMFRATGVAQAMAKSNDVVRYIAQLGATFDACAAQRTNAMRVSPQMLVEWSGLDLSDMQRQ